MRFLADDLLLGYLAADSFAGGSMRLDRNAAEAAFAPLCQQLGEIGRAHV